MVTVCSTALEHCYNVVANIDCVCLCCLVCCLCEVRLRDVCSSQRVASAQDEANHRATECEEDRESDGWFLSRLTEVAVWCQHTQGCR